jgi:hypothetical protein
MAYQLIISTQNGTLKQIAEQAGIPYEKGNGYYELTKPESVAAKKQLVLFVNGNFSTDSMADIRTLCGYSPTYTGNLALGKTSLPPGHQLFVQSSAPNRKIQEDDSVVFYDPSATPGSASAPPAAPAPAVQYAIKYEAFQTVDSLTEIFENDNLFSLFRIPVGVDWGECDEPVPMVHQLPSLSFLSQLTRTQWTQVDLEINSLPFISNERITHATAIGTLTLSDDPSSFSHPTRLEYYWTEEWSCYAVSIGMVWGLLIGSCGDHPYVLTPQFDYGNSDGSSLEMPPIALCECAERQRVLTKTTATGGGGGEGMDDYELQVTNEQRMDSICGHLLRLFATHCADTYH